MPVQEGMAPGLWPDVDYDVPNGVTIQYITDGEPATEGVLNRPSQYLDNRTVALRTFTEDQEILRDAQLGDSDSAIGGVQGTYNTSHKHTGSDGSAAVVFQDVYDVDAADAIIVLEDPGSLEIQQTGTTDLLFKIDGASKKITMADNALGTHALNYGTSTDQINLDEIPDGATTLKLTNTQKAVYDGHLAADNPHETKNLGFAYPIGTLTSVLGVSQIDISGVMSGETPDGDPTNEGIVTNASYNNVIVKNTNDDDILDAEGNRVYGRITENSGLWEIHFYSLKEPGQPGHPGGTESEEVLYSFTEYNDVRVWVQKIYSPVNYPTYNSLFQVVSDQVAGTINFEDLTENIKPAANDTYVLGAKDRGWKEVHVADGYLEYDSDKKEVVVTHDDDVAASGPMSIGLPPGVIMPFAGKRTKIPYGWLFCDGTSLNSSTSPEYAALYAAIEVTWGGSGPADFNLPNLQGQFLRGAGISGQTADPVGTREAGTPQSTTNKYHRHSAGTQDGSANGYRAKQGTVAGEGGNHTHAVRGNDPDDGTNVGHDEDASGTYHSTTSPAGAHFHKIDGNSGYDGIELEPEARPVNVAVNYIIKY